MGNMSYCRFENTWRDLSECQEAMEDDLDGTEAIFRHRIIELCKEIAEEYGDENDDAE
jgi:hypothetical protein